MIYYLLLVSVFSIPFYRLFKIWGVRGTTTEILFFMAFAGWLIDSIRHRNKINNTPLAMPIALLCAVSILSSFGAYNKFIAARETIQFIWLFGVYFFIYNYAAKKSYISNILLLCILAGGITSAIVIYKYFYISDYRYLEYRSIIASAFFEEQPNALGAYLIGVIPLSVALFIGEGRTRWKFYMLCCISAMSFALIMTFSRGSWIGLVFGLCIFIAIVRRPLIPLISALVLTSIVIWITIGPQGDIQQAIKSNIFHPGSDVQRLVLAEKALDMTIENPLIGVGPGNYGVLLPQELQYLEIPHNMFLQVSAETGLIGLAAFLWLLYAYYKASLKLVSTALNDEERIIRAGLIGSATAVLASGLFGWPFSHGVQEILILSMALSTADWGTDGS